jgi:site-specific DNA-methyltransferase (adenine-specific)
MSKELLGSIELNRIYQLDCLEGMKLIPNKSLNAIICDLPFGTTQNKWDSVISLDKLWEGYERIIKDNGAIILHASQPFTSDLINSNRKLFKYTWVWDKANPSGFLNAKKQPLRVTEDIVVFYKKQCTYNPQMETRGKPRKKGGYIKGTGTENYGDFHSVESINNEYYPKNLITVSNANRKEKQHPTQKPLELMEYLLLTYTNENDIVLDNCMGSGTLAVACVKNNRKFIGFETESKYIEIANQRIESTYSELTDNKLLHIDDNLL